MRIVSSALALVLMLSVPFVAQTKRVTGSDEQRTASRFESLRKSPPEMLAFVRAMPKGGDLHMHLTGAIYAESFVQWAALNDYCYNVKTLILAKPPCDTTDLNTIKNAAANPALYRQLIDAWSMRNWQYSGQSGHDHFFDAFLKFGLATRDQTGGMLAQVAARAARGNVLYLEVMLTPDSGAASDIGTDVGWNGNAADTLSRLKSKGIANAVSTGVKNLQNAEAEKNRLLKCGTSEADVGCAVTIRYIAQVPRADTPERVFAQMVAGFEWSSAPNSKVVAVNLVQPEDWIVPMQDFVLHMSMLSYLRSIYPRAHITLHAGELAPGIVPPEGLTYHIRSSVLIGGAERIGHGVSVMNEKDPYDLLSELARRKVMIEICLTSNDIILGIKGANHPLATYIKYGVPVALATDDEGVSRSEMSQEYLRAALEQNLGYLQLKKMARTSLQYAFLPGASLWSDADRFTPVNSCAQDLQKRAVISERCKQFLASSEKAKLQWHLEEDFAKFESSKRQVR